jgi:acetyl esterase
MLDWYESKDGGEVTTGGPEQRATTYQGLEFRQIVELAETVDPGASPIPAASSDLLEAFPELAAVEVRDVTIEGRHGDVAGRVYGGRDTAGTAFVWVHGGGFIGGDLEFPEAHWVALAIAASGFPVLSLDYHKALRGVHYPVPSDDVLDGWLWATAHADELSAAPDDLHLGGASAGGNLAAGVTKRLRDGAGPLPTSLVLVYPIVHADLPPFPSDLHEKLAADDAARGFSASMVRDMNLQYAGSEDLLGDPYAMPANGELGGQPPVLILNCDIDGLRASGEAYADALRAAGVDVTVEMEPGTHHGHLNEPDRPAASRSIERVTTWLRQHAARPNHS